MPEKKRDCMFATLLMVALLVSLLIQVLLQRDKVQKELRETAPKAQIKTHPVKKSYQLADDLDVTLFDLVKQAEIEASPDYVPPNQDGCLCTIDKTCNACEFRKNYEANKNKTVVLPNDTQVNKSVWEREARITADNMIDVIKDKLENKMGTQEFGYKAVLAEGTNVQVFIRVSLTNEYGSVIDSNSDQIHKAVGVPSNAYRKCNHTEYIVECNTRSKEMYFMCRRCCHTWSESC